MQTRSLIIGCLAGGCITLFCSAVLIGGVLLARGSASFNIGMIPPSSSSSSSSSGGGTGLCHINECHGMDLTCGNGAQNFACTTEYRIGDNCRQFFNCGTNANGACVAETSPKFTQCKACVETCNTENVNSPIDAFSCEAQCIQSLQ